VVFRTVQRVYRRQGDHLNRLAAHHHIGVQLHRHPLQRVLQRQHFRDGEVARTRQGPLLQHLTQFRGLHAGTLHLATGGVHRHEHCGGHHHRLVPVQHAAAGRDCLRVRTQRHQSELVPHRARHLLHALGHHDSDPASLLQPQHLPSQKHLELARLRGVLGRGAALTVPPLLPAIDFLHEIHPTDRKVRQEFLQNEHLRHLVHEAHGKFQWQRHYLESGGNDSVGRKQVRPPVALGLAQ